MIDTYLRGGLYAVPLPTTLGREGAGVISAVGSNVTKFKVRFVRRQSIDSALLITRQVGDRVAFCEPGTGAYADYVVLPASRVIPVPENVSLKVCSFSLRLARHLLAATPADCGSSDASGHYRSVPGE